MWSRQNEFSSDWTWSREQKTSLSQCTLLHSSGLKVDWRRVNGPWEKSALLQLELKLNHKVSIGKSYFTWTKEWPRNEKSRRNIRNPHWGQYRDRYITIGMVRYRQISRMWNLVGRRFSWVTALRMEVNRLVYLSKWPYFSLRQWLSSDLKGVWVNFSPNNLTR